MYNKTKKIRENLYDSILSKINSELDDYLNVFDEQLEESLKKVFLNIIQKILLMFIDLMKNIIRISYVVAILKKKYHFMEQIHFVLVEFYQVILEIQQYIFFWFWNLFF